MNELSELRYLQQRDRIETYFDRTAAQTWARLTSTAPVSGIRATVRAGRDQMRQTLLDWLPRDLTGKRVLDAGCGTGALSVELAKRGAQVLAIDLSPTLVALARERAVGQHRQGTIDFRAGDMFDSQLGEFDVVVAMDSLIHYQPREVVRISSGFAARSHQSILFTFPPKNLFLSAMMTAGRLFPRKDRAPFIVPMAYSKLCQMIQKTNSLSDFQVDKTEKISSGFYTSQAIALVRSV